MHTVKIEIENDKMYLTLVCFFLMANRYCYAKRFPKNGKQKITAPKQKQNLVRERNNIFRTYIIHMQRI